MVNAAPPKRAPSGKLHMTNQSSRQALPVILSHAMMNAASQARLPSLSDISRQELPACAVLSSVMRIRIIHAAPKLEANMSSVERASMREPTASSDGPNVRANRTAEVGRLGPDWERVPRTPDRANTARGSGSGGSARGYAPHPSST